MILHSVFWWAVNCIFLLVHQKVVFSFSFFPLFFDRYMVTSGMDKKLKVYDVRTFKPLKSYFLSAGAACLSLSQRGLLSAATGDVVQVIRATLCTFIIKKHYMLQMCPSTHAFLFEQQRDRGFHKPMKPAPISCSTSKSQLHITEVDNMCLLKADRLIHWLE